MTGADTDTHTDTHTGADTDTHRKNLGNTALAGAACAPVHWR